MCFSEWYFLVVQPVHLHQRTRAARARKSANMVCANVVSVALRGAERAANGSYVLWYRPRQLSTASCLLFRRTTWQMARCVVNP